jgi:hypothetical protein
MALVKWIYEKKRRARSSRLLAFPSRGEPASLTEGD